MKTWYIYILQQQQKKNLSEKLKESRKLKVVY